MNITSESLTGEVLFARETVGLGRAISRWRFVACIQAIDFAAFLFIALVWLRTVAPPTLAHASEQRSLLVNACVAGLAAGVMICVFHSFRLYDYTVMTRARHSVLRAIAAGTLIFVPFAVPLLYRPDMAQRPDFAESGVAAGGLLAVVMARFLFARIATLLNKRGMIGRRIMIVANNAASAGSLRTLLERSSDNRVVGIWHLADRHGTGAPVEALLQGALDFMRNNPVDTVILKLPLSQPNRLMDAARVLRGMPRQVLLAPSFDDGDEIVLHPDLRRNASIDALANMLLIKISDRPLAGWRWVGKDLQDRLIALILLVIISPALISIMIAIKLADPGPVFFRQRRFGYGGSTFDIIKFRSMRVSPAPQDSRGLKLTARDDPRIFPVGRILRKTSLDELPQLLNVLKGDMWIVGPRPHSPYAQAGGVIYAEAVQEYAARYRIKPGITGWAQVCGWRGPTETLEQLSKRVEHDLYYIENWSPVFDLKILFKTLFCAFGHENAF